jgi:hypothetical protein
LKHAAAIILAVALSTATAAQSAPRDAPEGAAGGRNKMICKRFVKTGSLVDGYRTCKPKWEWERERENIRQFGVSDACGSRGEPAAGPCNP